MAKKQFKAESKRLLELMIHSIYTNKDIFLRELISNASDAMDKLAYRALTDEGVGLAREDFRIELEADPAARTLTIRDNGIGMTREEMEQNLGTIAKSGSMQFKKDLEDGADVDIIGQFGVGFYSAFMVADRVAVTSRAYGEAEGNRWESSGVDGYTVTPCERETVGTEVVLTLKPDGEEEDYSRFLSAHALEMLVRQYSDYIRYPIRMEVERSVPKPRPDDAPEDYQTEYESKRDWETFNSMVPLWQRPKSEVTEEEYRDFYKERFHDWTNPAGVIHTSAEGQVSYKALLFIPAAAPFDFYTREFEKGLALYSSGVMIMERCADLLPDCFRFVRGVVDSPDFSLNISREMLQQTRELKVIALNLEKKIKAELLRLLTDKREEYEKFWAAFGPQIKYGAAGEYGAKKELLRDLLLFPTSAGGQVSLTEYAERMKEGQEYLYYVRAESADRAAKLPQVERILDRGFEVLFLTEEVDEFVMQTLRDWEGKEFKSVSDPGALPESEEDKERAQAAEEENRAVLDFVKETLGERVKEARISRILKSAPVCMTADGPVSLDMEKYFAKMNQPMPMKAERVLELNAESGAFAALRRAVEEDRERAAKYAELLYAQALLIADLPLEDPAGYAELVCSLMD